jgi:hypothetical protein
MLNKRKYCLSCSPYNQHNTKQLEFSCYETKLCLKCNEVKVVSDFYFRRNGLHTTPYCKVCSKKDAVERAKLVKLQCVKYMGNCCQECGYSKCIGALEFHHMDRNNKKYNISSMFGFSWNNIKKELAKCILLCNRCHVEAEYELRYGPVAQLG